MDAADELPELAIQRIQSFLPTKESARSCLLSKSWLRSFSTHPSLDFDESLLFGDPRYLAFKEYCNNKYPGGIEQVRDKFVDFVNTSLVRYTTQNLRIHKFRLSTTMLDCEDSKANADLIDEWIRVAIESGANELHLSLSSSYTLPETIFSAKSLQVLDICSCNFNRAHVLRIDFCNLKTLVLKLVYIDEHTIASLIAGIPLVEKITLNRCTGFTRIKVSSLDHLKCFKMYVGGEGQILDIEAPNLEYFTFSKYALRVEIDLLFDMNAFPRLKALILDGVRITDTLFNDLVPQLKFIVQLELRGCEELESINISSSSLIRLRIFSCSKLVAVTVDHAPNLVYFTYSCDNLAASISLLDYSSFMLFICLHIKCHSDLNTSWFLQLRGFLKNINHKLSYLKVGIKSSNQNCFNSADFLQKLDPSQADSCDSIEVEKLEVNIKDSPSSSSSSIWYPALLDGLFWTCHPRRTLAIAWRGSNSDESIRAFSKLLKSLMDQNSKIYWFEDGEYWYSLHKKTTEDNGWYYYLKDSETWSWEENQFTCDLRRDLIS